MKESVRGLIAPKKNIAIVYIGVGVPELSDIKESITKLLNKI
jgi:hypothetical protein